MARTRDEWRGARVVCGVLGLALAGLLAWGWWGREFDEQIWAKNLGVVEEGALYRSGGLTPVSLRRVVRERGIRTVVDLGGYARGGLDEAAVARVLREEGVVRHRYRLHGDGTGDPNRYVAALRVMADESAHPVLVHCAAGAQRTGACMIFYRTIVQGEDMASAREEALSFKHHPDDEPSMLPYVEAWWDAVAGAYRGELLGGIPYDRSQRYGPGGEAVVGAR